MSEIIKIQTKNYDSVMDSQYLTGFTNYEAAILKLYPLINRLDIQRKIQNETFYKRLEQDLLEGCVMPPLTIAFIEDADLSQYSIATFQEYVNNKYQKGIYSGWYTKAKYSQKGVFDKKQLTESSRIFLNIIICSSRDSLLYRMVTLNNGQKNP